MSETAFQVYAEALKRKHNRNEARRIRTSVTEARRNTYPAALRLPFELLQNALDAGPRKDNSSITIRLRHLPSKVVFEHDGATFTTIELAALLSGGSSKAFESDVTKGKRGVRAQFSLIFYSPASQNIVIRHGFLGVSGLRSAQPPRACLPLGRCG